MLFAVRRVLLVVTFVTLIWMGSLLKSEYGEISLPELTEVTENIRFEFAKLSDVDALNAYLNAAIPRLQSLTNRLLEKESINRLYVWADTAYKTLSASMLDALHRVMPVIWEGIENFIRS